MGWYDVDDWRDEVRVRVQVECARYSKTTKRLSIVAQETRVVLWGRVCVEFFYYFKKYKCSHVRIYNTKRGWMQRRNADAFDDCDTPKSWNKIPSKRKAV